MLEFQPSQNTAIRGNGVLINIPPKVWRPKVINRYIPTNNSSDIDEGFLTTNATVNQYSDQHFNGRIQIDRI